MPTLIKLASWQLPVFSMVYTVIPHPVASERRCLVKAPWWIHSVPDVSGRRLWHCSCYARLWNLHDITNTSRFCKHCFSVLPIDKTSSVEAQIGLLRRSFFHLANGCGIKAKDPSGLDSDWWIPHSRCCENPARAKALAVFSRHLSAGFTNLNPAPRGLSL